MSGKILRLYSNRRTYLVNQDKEEQLEYLDKEFHESNDHLKSSFYSEYDIHQVNVGSEQFKKNLNKYSSTINVFWFSGHANEKGLLFDDEIIENKDLVEIFKCCPNLRIVVLNGCCTNQLCELIYDEIESVQVVIGTEGEMPDEIAMGFGMYFLENFIKNEKTIFESFKLASNLSNSTPKKKKIYRKNRGPEELLSNKVDYIFKERYEDHKAWYAVNFLNLDGFYSLNRPKNIGKSICFIHSTTTNRISTIEKFRTLFKIMSTDSDFSIDSILVTKTDPFEYPDRYLKIINSSDILILWLNEDLMQILQDKVLKNKWCDFCSNATSLCLWVVPEKMSIRTFYKLFNNNGPLLNRNPTDVYKLKNDEFSDFESTAKEICDLLKVIFYDLLYIIDHRKLWLHRLDLKNQKNKIRNQKFKLVNFIFFQGSSDSKFIGDKAQDLFLDWFDQEILEEETIDYEKKDIRDISISNHKKTNKKAYIFDVHQFAGNTDLITSFIDTIQNDEEGIKGSKIEKLYFIFIFRNFQFNHEYNGVFKKSNVFSFLELKYPLLTKTYITTEWQDTIKKLAEKLGKDNFEVFKTKSSFKFKDLLEQVSTNFSIAHPSIISNFFKE